MEYIAEAPKNEAFKREAYLALKGLETWKKYQHSFPMNQIRLLIRESDRCGGQFAFILINPSKCSSIIEQHLSLFQSYCGRELSSQEILNQVCEGTFWRDDVLDPVLFGLLLGYPTEDVFAFEGQLKSALAGKAKNSMRPCRLAQTKNPFTPIKTPYFMTNREDEELGTIKEEYAKNKSGLVELFYSDDFLLKILERMIE
jgi:hypothetical protein